MYFDQTLIWGATIVKDDGVSLFATNKAIVLVICVYGPLLRVILLEVSLLLYEVSRLILIPDQLWEPQLTRQHKVVMAVLRPRVSAPELGLIHDPLLLDSLDFLGSDQLILVNHLLLKCLLGWFERARGFTGL